MHPPTHTSATPHPGKLTLPEGGTLLGGGVSAVVAGAGGGARALGVLGDVTLLGAGVEHEAVGTLRQVLHAHLKHESQLREALTVIRDVHWFVPIEEKRKGIEEAGKMGVVQVETVNLDLRMERG